MKAIPEYAAKVCPEHGPKFVSNDGDGNLKTIKFQGKPVKVTVYECEYHGCDFKSANAWDILDKYNEKPVMIG